MLVKSLSHQQLRNAAQYASLAIACGPTITRIFTSIPQLLKDISNIYQDYDVPDLDTTGADVCVDMRFTSLLRKVVRPQVKGFADRPGPFAPLPPDIAFVGYEMTQNWFIANTHNRHLMFHAACVANQEGSAVLLPGQSGSGKSTLGIAMGFRSWRYLGDEFAFFDPNRETFVAMPRPASLKNASIDVLRDWAGAERMSRIFKQTPKGRMAYLRPPADALSNAHAPARLKAVVFPKYVENEEPTIRRLRQAEALVELTNACVNFERLSSTAFDILSNWAVSIPCFQISYPSLESACEMVRSIQDGIKAKLS
ncbi:MAG: HprK-related kinase A [Pseudomonadota bacterium]